MLGGAHEILVKLAADSTGLIVGLQKGETALGKFETGAAKVRNVLGGLTAALGAIGVGSMVKGAVDAADALHDMAQRTGSSVEELSAMSLIAEQNGASLEGVGKAFRALAKNQAAAADGNRDMAALFTQMGISGDNALNSLVAVADKFKAMPDGMQKAALAQQLFGKAGSDMIPILNMGSAALKEQIDWAQKHAAITTEDANRADALGDKIAEMKAKANVVVTQVAAGPLDAMIEGLNKVLAWAEEHPDLASWLAMGAFGAAAGGMAIGGAAMAIGAISTAVGALMPILTGLATFLIANPVIAALLGVAAVGVAIYKNWDAIVGAFNKGIEAIRSTVKAWKKVGEDIIMGLWEGIKATLRKPLDAIESLAKDLPDWAKKALGIRSPSTVFAEIGEQVGAGLVQGLNNSVPDVKAATDKVLEAVIVEPSNMARTAGGKFKSSTDAARQGTGLSGGISEYVDSIRSANDAIKDMTVRTFQGMEDALTKFVMTGKLDFKSLTNSIIADMIRMQIQQNITKPLATAASAMFSGFFSKSAMGNVFSGPGISAFSGQVVNKPTVFPFAKGIGLMGEAGAEAIMPLKRGADGRLGVEGGASNNNTVNINFSVNAIDTQSAMGVIMSNRSAIIGMVQGAFNKAGRVAPMLA